MVVAGSLLGLHDFSSPLSTHIIMFSSLYLGPLETCRESREEPANLYRVADEDGWIRAS
jgi:hypothetical protein